MSNLRHTRKRIFTERALAAASQTSSATMELRGATAPFDHIIIYVYVVSVAGGGQIVPTLYGSPDGGTIWYPMQTATPINAAGQYSSVFTSPIPSDCKVVFELTGTSVFFGATAELVKQGM